jgi:hypothetical protein
MAAQGAQQPAMRRLQLLVVVLLSVAAPNATYAQLWKDLRVFHEGLPPMPVDVDVAFGTPVKVGQSNYSHFWMPSSVFKGIDGHLILSIDMAGDGKPCPPPNHPQNCSALYRSTSASGESWLPIYGNVPGMALPIPQARAPGKVRTFNFDSKVNDSQEGWGTSSGQQGESFEVFSAMWQDTVGAVERVSAESVMVPLTGFPPLAGAPAMSGNVVRLRHDPTQLIGTMYGRLNQSSGGCHPFEGKGAPPWPGCTSALYIASTDEGLSWAYRSHIDWEAGTMSPKAEGITESSIAELVDGRLLSVFRLQSDLLFYKSYSTDGAKSWTQPVQMPAWSVYPQLRALPNGVVILASGRPGLGLWLSRDTEAWTFHNLCAVHNKLYPDASFHFAATELAVVNASSPGTWPMQTKAYTGLVELGCEGDACKVLLTYDRLANGNDGPPPDGSKADAVFSMVVTVSPAQ